ncbi:Diphthine--ammonia ligase [Babesia sp. Xinjiang]|uniref:Diphthine--ammonia ligase n=1 Tax=Babesia sp. Xinjiang TaxID=462227 RepID=UPI000A217C6F|nr:Diphthine--ammonia ligase [Babesia sp. Xinjiang]ORM41904.1 Diphthine--ammonia ligase [Babesia sp. Xinjiang]
MKLLALISGGKDGIYSIIAAKRQGHEVVMLGHLTPKQNEDVNELDSFMYQTVGHNIVPAIAECMEMPIIERAITGEPIVTESLEYTPLEGDEVEDLYRIVVDALAIRNDIEGILTGAIASQYQLQRVLNVATRLGLKTVQPLWGREQSELLAEMIENDVDAIIIKTCSMGLNEKHLGRSIRDLYNEFLSIRDKYGFNVCGEGGEFESLVLDCPLYKKRIAITQHKCVEHSPDPFAPTLLYVPLKWELIPKR